MKQNERVLSSWLNMLIAVDSERVPSQLSYNESVICNILYSNKDKEMTATDLCAVMKMQKSLMNRTLNNLEEKQIVRRIRSNKDHRKIVLQLVEDNESLFMKQHIKSLEYVDRIIEQVGNEKVEEIIYIFETITKIAQEEK